MISVDKEKCTACGKCADICPEDVLRIENGTAAAVYPKECWACGSCVYDCAFGAIEVNFGVESAILFLER
jgi:adenylylsulfate reductase subunit B